jgi:hypothetical protein
VRARQYSRYRSFGIAIPFGGVIMDSRGRLFGTTLRNGQYGDGGTVFELSP